MRIISGAAGGRKLAGPKGGLIRPTPDRVREALFSMLSSRFGSLDGMRILDLFAGTGALGLEGVSRGAQRAVLVDRDRGAAAVITANIASCGMEDQVEFIRGEAPAVLARPDLGGPFDLIFLDPPYGEGLIPKMLEGIAERGLLAPGGIICAETARREDLPASVGHFRREEKRLYGSTAVHLYHLSENEAAEE